MIFVTVVYGTVCILGILAVLFPITCSRAFKFHRNFTEDLGGLDARMTRILGVSLLHGHHLLGPEAEDHELHVRGKSYCASCYGLLTGAILSVTTVAAFALSGRLVWANTVLTYVLYFAGVVGVVLGLVQIVASKIGARARFILAAVFVVGTSMMLIATDVLTESLMADLFVVSLAVFWILSRISLSDRT